MKRTTRVLVGLGYLVFFSMSCCVSTYFLFPYHRVRDLIVQEVERPKGPNGRRRPSGTELSIAALRPTLVPGGVVLEEVHVRRPGNRAGEDGFEVELDELTARVGVFSLLTGSQSVDFEAETGGGTIEGTYENDEAATLIEGELDGVSLRQLGLVEAAVGLPVGGRLSGVIDLQLHEEREQTEGLIELTIADLKVGDGRAKLSIPNFGDGITIPEIEAGEVELVLNAEQGVAEVTTFEGDGEDLRLRGSGEIHLFRPLTLSRLDVLLRIEFTDGFREQDEIASRLFTVMEMVPQLRPARTSDGALQYRLTGSVGGRVSTRPAGSASL